MDYNFTMKRFNGISYDNFYPSTDLSTAKGVLSIDKGGTGVQNISDLITELGIESVSIQTGTYTGTNTFGKSNPNKISCNFAPKLIIISEASSGYLASYNYIALWIGQPGGTNESPVGGIEFSLSDNTLSYWSDSSAFNQLNYYGVVYYYIVIG